MINTELKTTINKKNYNICLGVKEEPYIHQCKTLNQLIYNYIKLEIYTNKGQSNNTFIIDGIIYPLHLLINYFNKQFMRKSKTKRINYITYYSLKGGLIY